MRRALALVAALALPLAACEPVSVGPARDDLKGALLQGSEVPGGGWSLVGSTDRRPSAAAEHNPLTDAKGASKGCRDALQALDADTGREASADDAFARAVYRSAGGATSEAQTRDLNLTVESGIAPETRAERVRGVTSACTGTLSTQAGDRTVAIRITPASYEVDGAVGYSVSYDTDGLVDHFDMVVVPHGATAVSASVTGPDTRRNRQLLEGTVKTSLGKLSALDGA